jgi:CRISPR system Cascade subunit CasC
VAPWVVSEIAAYCQAIEEHRRNGLDDEHIKRQIKRDAGGLRAALSSGVDVALSGRMATSGLMQNFSLKSNQYVMNNCVLPI